MTGIGTPFRFVNPSRHGNLPLSSSSSSSRTRATRHRPTTRFSRYLQLPPELRLEITRITIGDVLESREKWYATQGNPVVLQSRRGVFRVQLKGKQPPSLAQLACVSIEWQVEIEKQLFKSLPLVVLPDSKPDEYFDLVAFSAIVTGPRRRYLTELQLESYREYPTCQGIGSKAVEFHRTGSSYNCIIALFGILGTWAQKEVADELLAVKLNIELQDFPLHHVRSQINQLSSIPCIGKLHIEIDPDSLPLALLCLLRKLPHLKFIDLRLSPRRFSHEIDMSHEIQVFLDGLGSATPHLKDLQFSSPFICHRQERNKNTCDFLTGNPLLSLREISYRLQSLWLHSWVDLSLFFQYYQSEDEDVEDACPAWPELQSLRIRGSTVKGSNPMREQEKNKFLEAVGRAARRMPKLQNMAIDIESKLQSEFRLGLMSIILEEQSGLGKLAVAERLLLSVGYHTPSSSAVRVWEEAFRHTNLAIKFKPILWLDENGNLIITEWQAWKE